MLEAINGACTFIKTANSGYILVKFHGEQEVSLSEKCSHVVTVIAGTFFASARVGEYAYQIQGKKALEVKKKIDSFLSQYQGSSVGEKERARLLEVVEKIAHAKKCAESCSSLAKTTLRTTELAPAIVSLTSMMSAACKVASKYLSKPARQEPAQVLVPPVGGTRIDRSRLPQIPWSVGSDKWFKAYPLIPRSYKDSNGKWQPTLANTVFKTYLWSPPERKYKALMRFPVHWKVEMDGNEVEEWMEMGYLWTLLRSQLRSQEQLHSFNNDGIDFIIWDQMIAPRMSREWVDAIENEMKRLNIFQEI